MEKRYIVGMFAGLTIAGMSMGQSHAMINQTAEVAAHSLNLRSLNKHDLKIGTLYKGDKVTIIKDLENGFVHVRTSRGMEGKCAKSYLKVANSMNSASLNTSVKKKVKGTDEVNIRSGAGTNYSKIGTLANGTIVNVIEVQGEWNRIKFSNGKIGYCSGRYLETVTGNSVTNSSVNVIAKKKVAGTDKLNVRSGAGTSYSKIDEILAGATVEVLESKGGWSKVRYGNGKIGYCSERYLTSLTSTATSQNTNKKYNNVVSSFSTKYSTGSNRANNVELAARKINGFVIKPGQTFSFRQAVGGITAANGFLSAPVMANGQISGNGIGGGVCQVSSTIYASALKAGLTNIQARTHSGKVAYMPAGVDAVISSTSDLKIKNTYKEDVVIYASYSGGTLTVKFCSVNPLLDGKRYEITTRAASGGKQVELRLLEKKGIFSKVVYTRTSNYVR